MVRAGSALQLFSEGLDRFGQRDLSPGRGAAGESAERQRINLAYMPAHEAVEKFPRSTWRVSTAYRAVVLSDVGAEFVAAAARSLAAVANGAQPAEADQRHGWRKAAAC